jgi:hypothetical protein
MVLVKIRMLNSVSGSSYSYGAGAVIEAPEYIALDLIQGGHAEKVNPEKIEKSTSKQAEQAEKRAAK